MSEIRFSPRAYCKIILHAAKYPHCGVNGLLLCESNKKDAKKQGKPLVIVDVVPLFHICLHLSPMAEIALTQVEVMANVNGLTIAGYYMANESLNDVSIEKPATRIADKISDSFSSAYLVVVDNRKLTLTIDEDPLLVLSAAEGKWDYLDSSSYLAEEENKLIAAKLLQEHLHNGLIDFDNHLDDITQDWRNISLNDRITALVTEKFS